MTKLTNNQNLGGSKLIRGYQEVEKEAKKKKEADAKQEADKKKEENKETAQSPTKQETDTEGDSTEDTPRVSIDTGDLSRKNRNISPQKKKELDDIEMTKQQAEDYDNEESEEEVRNIDQIIFVIHGIGQQMSERMGQNFVHGKKSILISFKGSLNLPLLFSPLRCERIKKDHEIYLAYCCFWNGSFRSIEWHTSAAYPMEKGDFVWI